MISSYWVETLGCPKNKVDSEKLENRLISQGLKLAIDASSADLLVVNTCAFIEAARVESVDTVLDLVELKKQDAKVVVTGCMAERYGDELARELPEVDLVAGFGQEVLPGSWMDASSVPVMIVKKPRSPKGVKDFDLLNLERRVSTDPWSYLKVAEGCNRACGFCAIPSFRGKQQSRLLDSIVDEANILNSKEIVLIAQDLASYGSDIYGKKSLVDLMSRLAGSAEWIRLLYIYPSELNASLIEAVLATNVPYFDLSLQHSSRPLLRKMRRWGSGDKFLQKIQSIREIEPTAVFRSSFIVGYPGETEEDHDNLLRFIEDAQLDWAGFFTFSDEEGTYANSLGSKVGEDLMLERLREVSELQDQITYKKRSELIGTTVKALVDTPGIARSYREAPEIDGIINVDEKLTVGEFFEIEIVDSEGPDLKGELFYPKVRHVLE